MASMSKMPFLSQPQMKKCLCGHSDVYSVCIFLSSLKARNPAHQNLRHCCSQLQCS